MNDDINLLLSAEGFHRELSVTLDRIRSLQDLLEFLKEKSAIFPNLVAAMVCCSLREGTEPVELDDLAWTFSQRTQAALDVVRFLSSSSSSSSSQTGALGTEKLGEFLKLFGEATRIFRANQADREARFQLHSCICALHGIAPVRPVYSAQQTRLLDHAFTKYIEYHPVYLLLFGTKWYSAAFETLPDVLHCYVLWLGVYMFQSGVAFQLSNGIVLDRQRDPVLFPKDAPELSNVIDEMLEDILTVLQNKLPDQIDPLFDSLEANHDEAKRRIANLVKLKTRALSPTGVSDMLDKMAPNPYLINISANSSSSSSNVFRNLNEELDNTELDMFDLCHLPWDDLDDIYTTKMNMNDLNDENVDTTNFMTSSTGTPLPW